MGVKVSPIWGASGFGAYRLGMWGLRNSGLGVVEPPQTHMGPEKSDIKASVLLSLDLLRLHASFGF